VRPWDDSGLAGLPREAVALVRWTARAGKDSSRAADLAILTVYRGSLNGVELPQLRFTPVEMPTTPTAAAPRTLTVSGCDTVFALFMEPVHPAGPNKRARSSAGEPLVPRQQPPAELPVAALAAHSDGDDDVVAVAEAPASRNEALCRDRTPSLQREPLLVVTTGFRLSARELRLLPSAGVVVADGAKEWMRCDVVVAEPPLSRSIKLLTALSSATHFVSRGWLDAALRSGDAHGLCRGNRDTWVYREPRTRASFEMANECSIQELVAIPREQRSALLGGARFFLTDSGALPLDEASGNHIRFAIEGSGGVIVNAASEADVAVVGPPSIEKPQRGKRKTGRPGGAVPSHTDSRDRVAATVGAVVTAESIYRRILRHESDFVQSAASPAERDTPHRKPVLKKTARGKK
jgi:hypothetical protein